MNKVILMGRLTKDPEYSTVGSKATPRTNMTIAVDRRYAAQGGERVADFITLVAWRQTAETAAKYLTKGSKIVVEGSIQTRTYDAQDGTKRYVTEVVVDNFEFCERRMNTGETVRELVPEQRGFVEIEDDQLPF